MWHTHRMPTMNSQQIQQVLRYSRVWVRAFQDTVELAAFAAEDVLAGKETEFSDIDKGFNDALDHVIYHTSHSTQAALTLLLKHRSTLTKPQLDTIEELNRLFSETSTRMAAFIEALSSIYVFRQPPH